MLAPRYRSSKLLIVGHIIVIFSAMALFSQRSLEYEDNWPQFRGPLSSGEAPHGNPPVRWDEKTNIRWKIPLPGLGHATPVVWGDRIFVVTAIPAGLGGEVGSRTSLDDPQRYVIFGINRKNGSILWRKTACTEAPHQGRHETGSWASCSPVTNGRFVLASFGSRGFYCYDADGNLTWEKDFGDMSIRFSWGEGSSPAISGDRIIIPWDHEGTSHLIVLDINTGRELWRASRNDGTSWATPLVVEQSGKKQVIVSAIRRSCSYDLETGKILWETRGMTSNPIPSSVSADGIVYLMGGYRESVLQAIALERARGSAYSSKAILWEYNRDTPYVPSPLLYSGALYFLKGNTGVLTCLDAITGAPYYVRQRLDGISGVYASPVAADGRVYLVGRNGVTVVLKHGPQFEMLAKNRLDDNFDASPVIAGRELFLRGHRFLYCIASQQQP